jgi:hypothetical protein
MKSSDLDPHHCKMRSNYKKIYRKTMFLQKFDILNNKQARPITNFNDEVTKLPSGDDITHFDGKKKLF